MGRRVGGWLGRIAAQVLVFPPRRRYGWLLFRATSFAQIMTFTRALLLGAGGFVVPIAWVSTLVAVTALLWLVELWVRNADDPSRSPGWSWGLGPVVCGVLFMIIVVFSPPGTRSFIYFQF